MTDVLPVAVAILWAMRSMASLYLRFILSSSWVIVRGAGFPKVDVGQDRVDLGEVKREFLSVGPVVDEFPGCRGGVRVSALPPG